MFFYSCRHGFLGDEKCKCFSDDWCNGTRPIETALINCRATGQKLFETVYGDYTNGHNVFDYCTSARCEDVLVAFHFITGAPFDLI